MAGQGFFVGRRLGPGVAIRYDDADRVVELNAHDLVAAGAPGGDLLLQTVQSSQARLAAGREVHTDWQAEQVSLDAAYRSEVRLRRQVAIGAWTVIVHGRVDGLSEIDGVPVIEEVKSTALDAARLHATSRHDWPTYVAQLEVYLWMLAEARGMDPVGRLVLVSLLDGARHVLGVSYAARAVHATIREKLEFLVARREERLAWLAARRALRVPTPFSDWRPGQEALAEGTLAAVERGAPLLVEAPTGLGKTAAVLHGVLRFALANDRQVFWATARTTQQRVALDTLARLRARGLALRVVTLSARDKVCLNDVVACRPDRCAFAAGHFDRVRDLALVPEVHALPDGAPEAVVAVAARGAVCPWQLAVDATEQADVVIGDYNYAFDPSGSLRRAFAEEPDRWIVVVDEAHQLVDRARGYASPRVLRADAEAAEAALVARATAAGLDPEDCAFTPFMELAREIADAVDDAAGLATGPSRDGESVAELSPTPWRHLADRIDELAMDYARLQAVHASPGAADPWVDCGRAVLRFASALASAGDETVALVGSAPGRAFVGLLCLDPSGWLGPRIRSFAAFVGVSATLSPMAFYRDLLGLDPDRLRIERAVSPFPLENRRILLAPRVSTAWKDRVAHAPRTAALLQECIEAVPGNVAVYFPSFEMLTDLTGRWTLEGREVLAQRRGMSEADRLAWLDRMGAGGAPVVLAAVLGGIFAEGIDLPPGALRAVLVAGPALPPVGLERDLLKACYDERYGEGFLYASLVPGLTRVVQAAGRLIRRPDDRGVIVLVGQRFRWRDTAALLPEDWDLELPDDPARAVAAFFAEPA